MFKSVSKLRLLEFNTGLAGCQIRVEMEAGDGMTAMHVSDRMHDKRFFGRSGISSIDPQDAR